MKKRVAIAQYAPCFLDRESTLDKAVELIAEAVQQGAKLVVFPEAFVPGYPIWLWRLRPGGDWNLSEMLHQRVLKNAVNLEQEGLSRVCAAAREFKTTVVIGINEREGRFSRTTLYNTVVTIDHRGRIVNRHRKLVPTNPERMIWGMGDASGLKVVDSDCGRLGALLCWENYMPLARYALYAQGIEVYVAPTYDSGDDWISTLQHVAREGGCWVLGAGVALRTRDLPQDFPDRERLYPPEEDWINPGDSVVIAPGGELVAGPLRQQQGFLWADIDTEAVGVTRRTLDVAGHYGRPDIFTLHVRNQKQEVISFD